MIIADPSYLGAGHWPLRQRKTLKLSGFIAIGVRRGDDCQERCPDDLFPCGVREFLSHRIKQLLRTKVRRSQPNQHGTNLLSAFRDHERRILQHHATMLDGMQNAFRAGRVQ
ncbi:hypothetical protein [Xanthobacter autotrophicus]|uniref:hypothetical protein n=1 Tax=Xanthobacter autotrophicus TaxID=280 RepID=UPI00372C5506